MFQTPGLQEEQPHPLRAGAGRLGHLARPRSEAALPGLERLVRARPEDPEARPYLALALAGRCAAALEELDRGAELAAQDRYLRPSVEMAGLETRLICRDLDGVLSRLPELLSATYERPLTAERLAIDPRFDVLRDDPRFRRLVEDRAAGNG